MENKFDNYTEVDIKTWITNKKVLFVTNSNLMPGTMYLASLKTYIDYVPMHNMHIVSGLQSPEPFYGIKVFYKLAHQIFVNDVFKKFDYIIYIDEDAFVVDFMKLMNIFYDFCKDDAYSVAGIQDGGVVCHRNHSKLFVNTFVSFWNVKKMRELTNLDELINFINVLLSDKMNTYKTFIDIMNENEPELLSKMNELADRQIDKVKKFRKENFNEYGEVPYCETVRNDPSNPIEPHQIPYSFKDGEETYNFEPYYVVEQAFVWLTKLPIYYMFASDLYNKDETECDNSGLTSAIYEDDTSEPVVVHTWFSRGYTKFPKNEIELYHTNRINSVISKYGIL